MSSRVSSDDRAYLYGDGLFETVHVERGQIRWLRRHIARLRRSGEELGYAGDLIDEGCAALESLRRERNGIWRVTMSRRPDERTPFGGQGSITTRWRQFMAPLRPRLGAAHGFYLPDDFLAEHKTCNYLRNIEARRRAQLQGYDDAVLVSACGRVGEASAANLIVVLDGRPCTPPIKGILPGVTREAILHRAAAAAEPIEVRPIEFEELMRADEIVLLSAAVGALSAVSICGRALDNKWALRAGQWLMAQG